MRRKPDWREKIAAVVSRYALEPFEWGRTDCAHFARDCVQAINGENILQFGFDGNYTSRLQLKYRLIQRNYRTIGQATADAMQRLGFREIPPRFAIEGDVGVTADGVLAVRFAQGFLARDDTGRFYTTPVSKAWRID